MPKLAQNNNTTALPSWCATEPHLGTRWLSRCGGEGNCYSNSECIAVFRETGCKNGDQKYACLQAYYQKQIFLQNQRQEKQESKPQAAVTQESTTTLQSEQSTSSPSNLLENVWVLPTGLSFVLLIAIGYVLIKKLI